MELVAPINSVPSKQISETTFLPAEKKLSYLAGGNVSNDPNFAFFFNLKATKRKNFTGFRQTKLACKLISF